MVPAEANPSSDVFVVGMVRFELTTPCSQSRCATNLRHIPVPALYLRGEAERKGIPFSHLNDAPFGKHVATRSAGRAKLTRESLCDRVSRANVTVTLRAVKSSVEALEGNKVKLVVEVDETEFDKDVDLAFRKLAKEVRLPGFRPGKAPRKVLEAHIGTEFARQEAFRDGLPNYYVEAVKEHDVDVIAPPEIDITDGQDAGPVTFDAVVEVRPSVEIDGYSGFELEIPSPAVDDAEIDEQIERMLGQYGTLEDADRPAADGDRVSIDIEVLHEGEAVDGLTADDYLYQVGMGAVVPEMDENLIGASVGDELEFEAAHPDEEEEEPLHFAIKVKAVQETVLPTPDDDWAKENSEFDTLAELREDLTNRMSTTKINQAIAAQRNAAADKLVELMSDDDIPEALVTMEFENRVQDMSMRLQAQGLDFEQFLQFSGQSRDDALAGLRDQAQHSAKLDLALRALAAQENIEVSDAELDEEFTKVAEQVNRPLEDIRQEFADAGQLSAVRSDLQKSKALDWLIDNSSMVDEDGNAIQAADLEVPEDPPQSDASDQPQSDTPEDASHDEADTEGSEGDDA